MYRFMVMTAIMGMLAAGCGTREDADKRTEVDWPARAAMVKEGMTRAEVEKILPRWIPPRSHETTRSEQSDDKHALTLDDQDVRSPQTEVLAGTGAGFSRSESYFVAEDWRVEVCYDFTGGGKPVWSNGVIEHNKDRYHPQNRLLRSVKIEKVKKAVTLIPTPHPAFIPGKWVNTKDGIVWNDRPDNEAYIPKPVVLTNDFACPPRPGKQMLAAASVGKEAPMDWPARAAMVKEGMTRAEVEKILPEWEGPHTIEKRHIDVKEGTYSIQAKSSSGQMQIDNASLGTNTLLLDNRFYRRGVEIGIGSGISGSEEYLVAKDWRVVAVYRRDSSGNQKYLRARANQVMRNTNDQKLWISRAASIKVGMTRAEADRYMPAWNGTEFRYCGNNSGSHEMYKFAENWFRATNYTWSLTIEYDGSGGDGSMQNHVINPVKIETVASSVTNTSTSAAATPH